MRIILASKSPDRKKLFKTIYDDFEVIDSKFDESAIKINSPKKLVETLATGKCEAVFNSTQDARCVIGVDTVVCIDNYIFGKPKDASDAKRMVKSYSGKTNKIVTGVCIKYDRGDGIETKIVFSNTSKIKFRKIYDDEIEKFLETKEYENIAGACTIEGSAGKFMDKIIGSYHSVLGLPTSQLYEVLREENLV